jgi:hypothetical protein
MSSLTYRRSDEVVFEIAGNRAVLLAADGRELITLNPVGTIVWELLARPCDLGTLTQSLRDVFPEVSASTLEVDADRFLASLVASNLVVAHAPG